MKKIFRDGQDTWVVAGVPISIGSTFGRWTVQRLELKRFPHAIVRCSCGTEKSVRAFNIVKGLSSSCGCQARETTSRVNMIKRRKPDGHAAAVQLFNAYRWNAERRNLNFELDLGHFLSITSSNCAYCGCPPSQLHTLTRKNARGSYVYNGIDRLDNTKGYLTSNVVSCCGVCNKAKSSMPVSLFLQWVTRIYSFQRDHPICSPNSD